MRPSFHDDPDARQKTEAFEVGMRVKVISPMVDFYAFRGEIGTVEKNSGDYLGIIVRFDEPRRFNNGHVQEWFNFNYYDLEPMQPATDANPVREEAVVRAHAWCVRLWNERKISAEFTSADEAELVEMMLGLLVLFPPPQPAEAADLRRQLAEAQKEWRIMSDALDMVIAERDQTYKEIDELQREAIVMVKENGKFRYYISELECLVPNAQRNEAARLADRKFCEAYPDVPEVQL